MVSPSVVLLDNHTTIWIGWKWDGSNKAPIKVGDYDARLTPFYFLSGGRYYTGSLKFAGGEGFYWSSMTYDIRVAYLLGMQYNLVSTIGGDSKFIGISIRCLAR